MPVVDTEVPEDFDGNIPNISKITPKDFTLIGNFLKRKDDFEFFARENLVNEFISYYFDKLSLKSVYNIESVEDLPYEQKLKWLIDIYNAYKLRGSIANT